MWESDWVTMLNSTVPYTGGSNIQGTLFASVFLTVGMVLLIIYMRNR